MRICVKCSENKELSEYGKFGKSKEYYRGECNVCRRLSGSNYRKTKKGLIAIMYTQQKQSSKRRGYELPDYTKQDFIEWISSQEHFEDLYNVWAESNYDKGLTPSVDRLDDYSSYTLDNIQLITWKENSSKGHLDRKNGINNKHSKAVLQYTLNGEFVDEYFSISNAKRITGATMQGISRVCNGNQNTAGGYKWEFSR